MSVQELNSDTGWLRWKGTSIEWLSVIIACTAVIISLVSAYTSIHADIRSEMYQQSYKELEREYRLAQLEIDDFKIAILKAGINIEHDGDKP